MLLQMRMGEDSLGYHQKTSNTEASNDHVTSVGVNSFVVVSSILRNTKSSSINLAIDKE